MNKRKQGFTVLLAVACVCLAGSARAETLGGTRAAEVDHSGVTAGKRPLSVPQRSFGRPLGALETLQVISPERERLLREYDRKDYTWPIVLTTAGTGPIFVGLVIYELMHSCFDIMGSGCSAPDPSFGELALPISLMASGVAMSLTGIVWWGIVAHQRSQMRHELRALQHKEQFFVERLAVRPMAGPSSAGLLMEGTF